MNLRAFECVSIDVNPSAEEETAHSQRLRADYRSAFRDWALQVDRLRGISDSTVERSVVKEAEERVKAAEAIYRNSRNQLTAHMNHPGGANFR